MKEGDGERGPADDRERSVLGGGSWSVEARPRGSAWKSPSSTPGALGREGGAPSLQALSSGRARGQRQV